MMSLSTIKKTLKTPLFFQGAECPDCHYEKIWRARRQSFPANLMKGFLGSYECPRCGATFFKLRTSLPPQRASQGDPASIRIAAAFLSPAVNAGPGLSELEARPAHSRRAGFSGLLGGVPKAR